MRGIVDSRIAYVTVEHTYYGCETGCCGWIAYAYDSSGTKLHESSFEFMHSYADTEEEQRREVQEFAELNFPRAPVRWEECDYRCNN